VLRPQGHLSLLVLVQVSDELPEQPDGNRFPTEREVADLLEQCGFLVVEQVDADQIPAAPLSWQGRLDRLNEVKAGIHGHEPAWKGAEGQSALIGRLLREGHVRTVLLHVVAT
jgi:hypothetical protein